MKIKKSLIQWIPNDRTNIEYEAEFIFNKFKLIREKYKSAPSPEFVTDIEKLSLKVIASNDKSKKKRKKYTKIKNINKAKNILEYLI